MLPFRKSVFMPLYQISGIIVFISESYASWSHPSNKLQFPLDRGKEGGHDSEPKHINNPCLVRWMHRPASQTLLFCQTFTVAAAGSIQPWWGDRREGAGGWLGGCCCSSCKVPFFHTGKGRSHPTTCLNMDKAVRLDAGPRWQTCSPDFCDRGAGAHWAHRSTVPLGLDFVLPYRRHDLGGLVVRRAGLPASPGSRLFGHVTKILVT